MLLREHCGNILYTVNVKMICLSFSDQISSLSTFLSETQSHIPEKVIKITDMLIVKIGKQSNSAGKHYFEDLNILVSGFGRDF